MQRMVYLSYAFSATVVGLFGTIALGLLQWDFWFPGSVKTWNLFPGGMQLNLVLLLIFGLQHSLMARRPVKRLMAAFLTEKLVTPTYVMWSGFTLFVLVMLWSPSSPPIYDLSGTLPGYLLLAVSLGGGAIIALAGWQNNGLELLGIPHLLAIYREEPMPEPLFSTPGLYQYVRHPLYLGILIMFWCTPAMTHDHLFFAEVMTAYILVGAWFEERDLRRRFGKVYGKYQNTVPMLIPFTKRRKKPK